MTRALFVSHTAELGGAELFMQDLLLAGEPGWRGAFLSAGPAADALRSLGHPPITLTAGKAMLAIRRNASVVSILAGLGDVIRVASDLAYHLDTADVVCANSQKALFVCAIAAALARKPLVWVLHDIITDPAFSTTNRRAALFFTRHFAELVVVNSRATGDAFVAAGGQREKLRIVHNGFNTVKRPTRDPTGGRLLRATLGFNHQPLVGLFGRLSPWKGQHVLLDALVRVPQLQAVIVGAALFADDGHEAQLRAQCTRLGLDDRVRFLGFRSDVPELMAAVDVVVHASTAPEPFGRVVVEGLLAGRPVIATHGGGVSEIITHGHTGLLVPPDDPAALADTLTTLLADPTTMARLALVGHRDATHRFTLDAMARQMAAVLDDVSLRHAATRRPEPLPARQVDSAARAGE